MPAWIITIGVGAALGGLAGHFGSCTGGACPLMATWWRGAIYGGVLGLMIGMSLQGGRQ